MRIDMGIRAMAAAAVWASCVATAQAAPSQDEARQVWQDAGKAATKGPADVALGGQAHLHLPAGEAFVPSAQAARLLAVMGNPGDDPQLQGMILPQDMKDGWFMVVEWHPEGYVKDDDAKNWNADDLLKGFREGTAEGNKEREKMGVPQLDIIGWAEPPKYDSGTQHLVWAMSSREIGAPADRPQIVNYNTYALGREGYFTMNLVADLADLPALKPVAARQIGGLEFDAGKRYADFDASKDHVAEYGLAALVVGVAAHKLGLLAVAGLFLAKFAKLIFIGLAVFGGSVMKFFRRKPAAAAPMRAASSRPLERMAAAAPPPSFEPTAPAPPLPPLDFPATQAGGLDGGGPAPNPPGPGTPGAA